MTGVPPVPPQEFISGGEGIVASYDWTDIAEGSGKVLFYGSAVSTSAATTYALLTNQTYSVTIDVNCPGATLTLDFYTPAFNLPKIVAGTAYIVSCTEADGAGNVAFQFKLYRGGADVANISNSITSISNTAARTSTTPIPLTQTNIKKGDMIHLVAIMTRTGGTTHYMGIDPMNRDGTSITPSTELNATTKLLVYIPFRIDL